MRPLRWMMAIAAIALVGCRGSGPAAAKGPALPPGASVTSPKSSSPIATPGRPLRGRIASVNPAGRFVVLRFPIGVMPSLHQRLAVYRDGLKVGELKVSGPQYDNNTVADIVAGESQIGDEIREE